MLPNICSICHINPHKYKCPACGVRTCSAECVSRHKSQTECTGLVDSTKFISKKEIDTTNVNRDYNFLLSLDRKIDIGKKDVKSNAKNVFKKNYNQAHNKRQRLNKDGESNIKHDNKLRKLLDIFPAATQIERKGVNVIQVANGMQRSTQNKTGYDKKQQCYVWTIEWVILNLEGKEVHKILSYKVKENLRLMDAFPYKNVADNLLQIVKTSKIEDPETFGVDSLSFYMKNLLEVGKKVYFELDSQLQIFEMLKQKLVLEFPTIYVTLKNSTFSDNINLHSKSEDESIDSNEDTSATSSDSSDGSSEDSSDEDSSDDDSEIDEAPEESSSKTSEPRSHPVSGLETKNIIGNQFPGESGQPLAKELTD